VCVCVCVCVCMCAVPLSSKSAPALTDVTFDVPRGQLLAVVGPVGSGKSALISALLNELYVLKGEVIRVVPLVYAHQICDDHGCRSSRDAALLPVMGSWLGRLRGSTSLDPQHHAARERVVRSAV